MIHDVPLLSENQTEKNGLEILKPCIFMPDAEAERVTRKGVIFLNFFSFCKHHTLAAWSVFWVFFLHRLIFFEHLPNLHFLHFFLSAKAICIDSEEEAVAPRKRRRKTGKFQARISTGAFKSLGKNEGWITGVGERERILEEIQIQCKGLCT